MSSASYLLRLALLFTLLASFPAARLQAATIVQATPIEAFVHADGNPTPIAAFTFAQADDSQFGVDNLGSFSFSFTNNTGNLLNNATFTLFLDLDIDRDDNTFFNEYGDFISFFQPFNAPLNSIAFSAWEIDEPDYAIGNIYANSLIGDLEDDNAILPSGNANDVAHALLFQVAQLALGQTFTATGTISLTDAAGLAHIDPTSNVTLYINGFATLSPTNQNEVPEPTTAALVAASLAFLYRRSNNR
jgi:hypothetical protein